jgi:ArsR family transcriptional regulator
MARPRKIDQLTTAFDDQCEVRLIHVGAVRDARAALPQPGLVGDLAALFAALGDPTRLRIVAALDAAELCVCDLAATLGLSESAVSHQLRHLRQLGLVRSRRDGRLVYYTLDDEHVATLFRHGSEHVAHRVNGEA